MKTLGGWIQVRPLTPHDAMGWVVRVARGLEPLHELDVPHGRVTAEAVVCEAPACRARALLLDADEVRRDFNYYSAARCKHSGASTEDDVWALGVLLYHGLTGAFPFPGEHRRAVRERIEWRAASPLTVYDVAHPRLQSLVGRMFGHEGPRVVTLGQLVDALLAIDPSLDELPALVFGVATGDEVSAARREPVRSQARAAAFERTVERVSRELDADEEAIVLERLIDGIAPDVAVDSAPLISIEHAPVSAPQSVWLTREPPPEAPSVTQRRRSSWHVLGIAATAALVVLLIYASGRGDRAGSTHALSATRVASVAPPKPREPVADVSECVASVFERDTFEATKPRFEGLCRETNPQRAADALKTEIVLGKGTRDTTAAMRSWVRLGWYQLAFVAALRERCCTAPPPLAKLSRAACSYDARLAELGKATASGDERSFRMAMAAYAKAADCLAGAQDPLARDGRPSAGEAEAFVQAVRRLRE